MPAGFILRGRLVAFDNVAVGSPAGRERTTGFTPTTEAMGGGFGGSTDPAGATSCASALSYSNKIVASVNNTTDPQENYIRGVVTPTAEDAVSTS